MTFNPCLLGVVKPNMICYILFKLEPSAFAILIKQFVEVCIFLGHHKILNHGQFYYFFPFLNLKQLAHLKRLSNVVAFRCVRGDSFRTP